MDARTAYNYVKKTEDDFLRGMFYEGLTRKTANEFLKKQLEMCLDAIEDEDTLLDLLIKGSKI